MGGQCTSGRSRSIGTTSICSPTGSVPDAYERTLPEVFPDFAPGNFTYDEESHSWVWTTFNTWQWDLNWHNPDVFYEFADLILWLANLGVECLRLDAIAFIYKRMGTNCQNQPEVHAITQALRTVARIAAPALIFKAEAIVGPADLAPYLGVGKHAGQGQRPGVPELLDGADLVRAGRERHPAVLRGDESLPGEAADDGVGHLPALSRRHRLGDRRRRRRLGRADRFEHRRFLADYYAGLYPMSDARGLVFQENLRTGDRRISGTAASLAGIEAALNSGDDLHLDLAVRRYLLAYSLVLGFGGLPLIYMGDELGLLNYYDFVEDPDHADDNRWVHRPPMPWDWVDRRHIEGTVEYRIWHGLRHIITGAVLAAEPGCLSGE